MDAARAGLRLAFDDEMLWRDLLRRRTRPVRRTSSAPWWRRSAPGPPWMGCFLRMAPQTESLIDDLYPSWRSTVLPAMSP